MGTWKVQLTRKACKQFSGLPYRVQALADLALIDLEEQGLYPRGWNVKKTARDEYRLRINYRYRMRYRITHLQVLEIEIFYIGHRREAYR